MKFIWKYMVWLAWLIGGVWVTTCVIGLAVIFLLGWTNGDALLLLFNTKGEKWIEMVIITVGTVCATFGGVELVKRCYAKW
jgi:hypothetical protein